MTNTVETVFEKGVFRPLHPVAISENKRIRIQFDDEAKTSVGKPNYPKLLPGLYPDDQPMLASDHYHSVPPKSVSKVQAHVVLANKLSPMPYSDDE
jgi:hypothetical protein